MLSKKHKLLVSFLTAFTKQTKNKEKTMENRRLFQLDNRLLACGQFVQKNTKLVDVGTDHAYLPIWLVESGIISRAIACDLREGPLLNAQKNIKKYGLTDKIITRISDGLTTVQPDEADTIVIAGMGGEIITQILQNAPWLKNINKNIILQPMTHDETLRKFLKEQNFTIIDEIPVFSHNKIYSVINAKFSNEKILTGNLYEFIGKICAKSSPEAKIYISQKIYKLKKQLLGIKKSENFEKYNQIFNAIKDLEKLL